MKDLLTAFFMAWGNFLNIPCPVKKWDDNLKKEMLKTLPSVGLVIGVLWFVISFALWKLRIPAILSGFIMTSYIYFVTGFFHLDGFMDVRDAVMSRRDILERQKILKDSHVGAFSVISVALLILGMFAGTSAYMTLILNLSNDIEEMSQGLGWIYLLPLIVIPVVSRTESGSAVLNYRAMETSQYSNAKEILVSESSMDGKENIDDRREKNSPPIIMVIQSLIYFLVPFIIALIIMGKYEVESLAPGEVVKAFSEEEIKIITLFLLSWACTLSKTHNSIKNAKKDLGGMNGDIAGYGICMGEVIGVISLPVIFVLLNLIFTA